MIAIRAGGWMLAGMLALTAGTAGLAGAALAQGGAALQAMHGGPGHMRMADPAEMDARFERHLAEMVPDATAEQKARLKAIAASVHGDMAAIHGQLEEAHRRAHALLLAASIDRQALQRLRAEEMRQIDTRSQHLLSALADAAEVLTPEQRQRVAARLAARPH